MVGSTSAPSARHKEKKAFKYNQKLVHTAPLGTFYYSNALLTVQFSSSDSSSSSGEDQAQALLLEAQFPMNSLHVNESQWIILNLRKKGEAAGTTETVEDGSVPTLRIKANLEGAYRPEIAALLHSSKAWFNLVDGLHSNLPSSSIEMNIREIPQKYPVVKFLLIPAVPLTAIVVALLPVIAGILIVGLPFFLPFLVVLAGFAASVLGIVGAVYYSTTEGREKVLRLVHPVASHMISTPVGQRLVFGKFILFIFAHFTTIMRSNQNVNV